MSLSLASRWASVPVAFQLYLPEPWAEDRERRTRAGVPPELGFRTRWQIALALVDAQRQDGERDQLVLADPTYGRIGAFRDGLAERGLAYVVGVDRILPLGPGGACAPHPQDAASLAKALPASAWQPVAWTEGAHGLRESRFATVRMPAPPPSGEGPQPGQLGSWLVAEWPAAAPEPTGYWLSNLPAGFTVAQLVRLAKLPWRIALDQQEMKENLGLDHYAGRGWRGFHHHLSLCAAAYAFLVAERCRLNPFSPLDLLRSPSGAGAPGAPPRGHRPLPD